MDCGTQSIDDIIMGCESKPMRVDSKLIKPLITMF